MGSMVHVLLCGDAAGVIAGVLRAGVMFRAELLLYCCRLVFSESRKSCVPEGDGGSSRTGVLIIDA